MSIEVRADVRDKVFPIPGPWDSVEQVQRHHATREVDWFAANDFFSTVVETGLMMNRFFVTSEQFEASDGSHPYPRLYTIRGVADNGDICTVGEFQQFTTSEKAREALAAWTLEEVWV